MIVITQHRVEDLCPFRVLSRDRGPQKEEIRPQRLIVGAKRLVEDIDEVGDDLPFSVAGFEKVFVFRTIASHPVLGPLAKAELPHGIDQALFAAEVIRHGIRHGPGPCSNVPHGYCLRAMTGEELPGGLKKTPPGIFGHLVAFMLCHAGYAGLNLSFG